MRPTNRYDVGGGRKNLESIRQYSSQTSEKVAAQRAAHCHYMAVKTLTWVFPSERRRVKVWSS
jgi:hypothetical protein